jgi:hypothetical protein
MSLELKPDLLEQAQLVAELMESGELIFDDRRRMENPGEKSQGLKRNASTMAQGDNETEIEENSRQHKEKRLSNYFLQYFLLLKWNEWRNNSLFQNQLLSRVYLLMLRCQKVVPQPKLLLVKNLTLNKRLKLLLLFAIFSAL